MPQWAIACTRYGRFCRGARDASSASGARSIAGWNAEIRIKSRSSPCQGRAAVSGQRTKAAMGEPGPRTNREQEQSATHFTNQERRLREGAAPVGRGAGVATRTPARAPGLRGGWTSWSPTPDPLDLPCACPLRQAAVSLARRPAPGGAPAGRPRRRARGEVAGASRHAPAEGPALRRSGLGAELAAAPRLAGLPRGSRDR